MVILRALIMYLICSFEKAGSKVKKTEMVEKLFEMTADDMFKAAIGDVHDYKKKLESDIENHLANFSESRKAFRHNKTIFFSKMNLPTATKKSIRLVSKLQPSALSERVVNMDEIKLQLKKNEINKLINEKGTPIPDFESDSDDPLILTRRFDESVAKMPDIPDHSKAGLRQLYHSNDNQTRIYQEKVKILHLMRQFIYMTRDVMVVLTELRRKYKKFLKYQIGYLFGLLRLVRYQQKTLYSTLVVYNDTLTSPTIIVKFYFKILRLDIDVNDLVRYILRINHQIKLEFHPKYYDDTEEYYGLTKIVHRKKP